MQISCDCLNIIICSTATEFSSIETTKECFPENEFFKEDVALLVLCSVTVQVSSLINEKNNGEWKVVACLNCGQACYSTCKNLAVDSLVVKRNLEKETSQINAIKQSNIYSPIFKVLVYDHDIAAADDIDLKTSLYPAAIAWLSEQTAKTEERIKLFTEKEYLALDELRKRAYKDQIAINRKEKEVLKEINKTESIKISTKTTNKTPLAQSFQKSSDKFSHGDDTSLDAEGVFLFEEFENTCIETKKIYESDSEGSDNETYVSRKIGCSQLAKSLPIPVPQFMEDRQNNDPGNGSPQVPSDIAASIKALAKSVHGDAIFGELPKPRFSTNI